MGLITAIRFLTIIPVSIKRQTELKDLGESLPYFPLIGLALGAILLLLNYLLSIIFPATITYALIIMALVILTGAHHIDGLIDTFDGFVAGKTKMQRQEIMSDNRAGAFGITAVVLLIMIKYTALVSSSYIIPTILLMPVLGRWMMVSTIFTFRSAKDMGMGFAFKQGMNWYRFLIPTIMATLLSVILLSWQGLILIASLWISGTLITLILRLRFGGLTGDNYGAVNELSETLVTLLMVIITRFTGR